MKKKYPFWLQRIVSPIEDLKGRVISEPFFVREAIRWEGENEQAVFSNERVAFEQLAGLFFKVDGITWTAFQTTQVDSEWSLCLREDGVPHDFLFEDGEEQKRKYTIEEGFPCGLVEDIEICIDFGSLVSEVLLTIEGRSVMLFAGEIYEASNGDLSISRPDESVILVTSIEQLENWQINSDEPTLLSRLRNNNV
jgi:hypothetical protein